jgi:hypothetical protein
MKISKHITFFYVESRLIYLNQVIEDTNTYGYETDLFIHTNVNFLTNSTLSKYSNGRMHIIYHDLTNIHPYLLTWKCRDLLQQQKNEYDIFMYTEDDILVPYKAVIYWLDYHTPLVNKKYNLGFVRIEKNKQEEEFITDIRYRITNFIILEDQLYGINLYPYCGFWIYDKVEFNKFVESRWYERTSFRKYNKHIRENSAFGLNKNGWYTNTIIPIINNNLIDDCKVYHLPNNYIGSRKYAKIKFNNAIQVV